MFPVGNDITAIQPDFLGKVKWVHENWKLLFERPNIYYLLIFISLAFVSTFLI